MSARLQDLQRSFLRHLRAEGRSPATLRLYGQSVTFFARWLESQGRELTLAELNRPAIRAWLARPQRHPRTRHRQYPLPGPVPVITDDDLTALLKACVGKEFNDRRDEAMIRLLMDCGIWVSELCRSTPAPVSTRVGLPSVPVGSGCAHLV